MTIAYSNKLKPRPYVETSGSDDDQSRVDTNAVPHHPVFSPSHYTNHPSGIECIQIFDK